MKRKKQKKNTTNELTINVDSYSSSDVKDRSVLKVVQLNTMMTSTCTNATNKSHVPLKSSEHDESSMYVPFTSRPILASEITYQRLSRLGRVRRRPCRQHRQETNRAKMRRHRHMYRRCRHRRRRRRQHRHVHSVSRVVVPASTMYRQQRRTAKSRSILFLQVRMSMLNMSTCRSMSFDLSSFIESDCVIAKKRLNNTDNITIDQ
jgi:hypothetical protein